MNLDLANGLVDPDDGEDCRACAAAADAGGHACDFHQGAGYGWKWAIAQVRAAIDTAYKYGVARCIAAVNEDSADAAGCHAAVRSRVTVRRSDAVSIRAALDPAQDRRCVRSLTVDRFGSRAH